MKEKAKILDKDRVLSQLEVPEELKEGYKLCIEGDEYWKQGRILDAIERFETALSFFQEKKAYKELANVLEALGDMYFMRQRIEPALRAYKACLDICENFEDELSVAIIAEKIVHVYRELKEYEKMLPYLNRLLDIAEKFGDAHRAARAMAGMGDVYARKKDYQTAKEAYEIALKIYRGIGAGELAKVIENAIKELEKLKEAENGTKT
jgi:tetratricopeptide (TPR) repeat protein